MDGITSQIAYRGCRVYLPMPLYPVIEDVGWWLGEDGSASGQPYRNAFPRRHCLEDYKALVLFARRLGVRPALGMVLGEWDSTNRLGSVEGATWMGTAWDNRIIHGSRLQETAGYLADHSDCLELALHGLCHEFWRNGVMERTEFHDVDGNMRPPEVIKSHLQAFGDLLDQHGLQDYPRIFVPPALYHSSGNDEESIQAILHDYGIRYVITLFSRMKWFAPPRHQKLTWEMGVGLIDRGLSPVSWRVAASRPECRFDSPILALHWANLLHPDKERSVETVTAWADMLLEHTAGPERILSEDIEQCWNQAAAFYYGRLVKEGEAVVVDLHSLPQSMPHINGAVQIKVQGRLPGEFQCRGGSIINRIRLNDQLHILTLKLEKDCSALKLTVDK